MEIGNKKILVTGANGDIALAIGRALTDINANFKVFGADLGEQWPGRAIFLKMYELPRADSAGYIQSLIKLHEAQGFDLIIPATEPELTRLMEDSEKITQLPLLMNESEVLRVGLDKQRTYDWLKALGVSVANTMPLSEVAESDLPVFVKPRSGSGSRNLSTITEQVKLSLVQSLDDASDYVAQELLEPNEGEYTCALFKAEGEVRTLVMRRWLVGGMTGKMVVCINSEIEVLLGRIAKALPSEAAINIQLRVTDGVAKVFEINPRLSSTVMMRHQVGFSDLKWWLAARKDIKPPPYNAKGGTWVYRTYGEFVVTPEEKEN